MNLKAASLGAVFYVELFFFAVVCINNGSFIQRDKPVHLHHAMWAVFA